MDLKKIISKLEDTEKFKDWRMHNKDSYLVHIFFMEENPATMFHAVAPGDFDIGYYNTDDTIATFEIRHNEVNVKPADEIFKKDESKVRELDLSKAELKISQISKIAHDFLKKEYPKELPNKVIYILQNIEIGQVWNITIVTATFNTLNLKIDSSTGEVLEAKMSSLLSMGEFIK